MRWLKRKLRQWLREDELEGANMAISKSSTPDFDDDSIRFNLTHAIGGRILQVTRYTTAKSSSNSIGSSRSESSTYVIPTGEDVGERVAKILNLELLK